jgi:hypothetical protein
MIDKHSPEEKSIQAARFLTIALALVPGIFVARG